VLKVRLMATGATKEKRSELVGALVTPTIKQELTQIAERDDRSLSFVAGALIERGLDGFRRDGVLRPRNGDNKDHESKSKGSKGKLGVITAKTEDGPRRKTKP
jgi:hypothetical protein